MTLHFLPPARLAAAAFLCGYILNAQPGPKPGKMEGSVHRAARADSAPPLSLRRMAKPRAGMRLRALTASERSPVSRKPGLTPVGISRAIPADAMALGEWSVSAEGARVWRLLIESKGADAIRIRFADFHAGRGKVWILSSGGEEAAGPYTGGGPFADGEFWSDFAPGESAIVAYEPASGADSTIPFSITELSHRFQSAVKASDGEGEQPARRLAAAASCAVDVTCKPELSEPASAVALIRFESEGRSYQCSGALVNSASQPAQPFFLTANHCIGDEQEARSVVALFRYQTPSCNGTPPALLGVPRVAGATFIAGGGMAEGDYALILLNAFPPVDVKVLGWSPEAISANEQVTGISHPRGHFKRVSLGRRARDITIRFPDGERMPASAGYQVTWFEGVTQGGSSGSPLLASINGSPYVVGTLSAGPDVDEDDSEQVCRAENLVGSYGRFSVAFPALSPFLTSSGGSGGNQGTTQASLIANPGFIAPPAGQTTATTTLSWRAPGVTQVQIRVGSPAGAPMTGVEGPIGSAVTGNWVADGMTFYLQDASSGDSSGASKTLATTTVRVIPRSAGLSGSISATPNPIVLAPGESAGRTTLTWQSSGVTRVQIRVGSPTGTPLTGFEQPAGATTTGPWVVNGMTFFLQDASDGNSAGASKTLASIRVQVLR